MKWKDIDDSHNTLSVPYIYKNKGSLPWYIEKYLISLD